MSAANLRTAIGAASTSQLSNYLPLSGGNITGSLTISGNAVATQSWVNQQINESGGYVLPAATSSALGGVRIGFPESGKNYPVELNDNN